jgi:hypothetical protein
VPETIRLDPKDQPILLAAIHGKADYLLTGDAGHFGRLYGKGSAACWCCGRHSISNAADDVESAGFALLFR